MLQAPEVEEKRAIKGCEGRVGGQRPVNSGRGGAQPFPQHLVIFFWTSATFCAGMASGGNVVNNFNLQVWTKAHNLIPQGIKFLEHTFTEPASFRLRVSP